MFELETRLKLFGATDSPDIEIPLTLGEAREIVDAFKAARTALRRIVSLGEKNVPKYAQQIAKEGLAASTP